jgi:hypothetical protein
MTPGGPGVELHGCYTGSATGGNCTTPGRFYPRNHYPGVISDGFRLLSNLAFILKVPITAGINCQIGDPHQRFEGPTLTVSTDGYIIRNVPKQYKEPKGQIRISKTKDISDDEYNDDIVGNKTPTGTDIDIEKLPTENESLSPLLRRRLNDIIRNKDVKDGEVVYEDEEFEYVAYEVNEDDEQIGNDVPDFVDSSGDEINIVKKKPKRDGEEEEYVFEVEEYVDDDYDDDYDYDYDDDDDYDEPGDIDGDGIPDYMDPF